MPPDSTQRRQQRVDFMKRLYQNVDASVSEFVSAFEIGDELGIPAADCARLIEYLQEKQYIHIDDFRLGIIRLTAQGVDYVEAST